MTTPRDAISGPCCVCGATNYGLSCGGPSICPSCDCGNFGPEIVKRQKAQLDALQERVKDLEAEKAILFKSYHLAVTSRLEWRNRATRAEQERDEALERAAEWQRTLWFILRANDGFTLERDDVESFPGNDRAEIVATRDNCDGSISFSAVIRRLASGPDKESSNAQV